MERIAKLSKSAELPFLGGVFITVITGAILWTSLLYAVLQLF